MFFQNQAYYSRDGQVGELRSYFVAPLCQDLGLASAFFCRLPRSKTAPRSQPLQFGIVLVDACAQFGGFGSSDGSFNSGRGVFRLHSFEVGDEPFKQLLNAATDAHHTKPTDTKRGKSVFGKFVCCHDSYARRRIGSRRVRLRGSLARMRCSSTSQAVSAWRISSRYECWL